MNRPFDNQFAVEVPLRYEQLTISDEEIFSYLGYKDSTPSADSLRIIRALQAEIAQICMPRFGYIVVSGAILNKRHIVLNDAEFTPDGIIVHSLKNSEQFAIILATVGAELDCWIHSKRVDDDIMKAFVADGLGSVVVEAVVTWGVDYLERIMHDDGLKTTNSYSPGYCGWDVKEQQLLFSLLPIAFCGITLTESSLMLPIKSVSAVVGIGDNVERKAYGCAICQKKDCYKRRLVK